MFRRTRSRQVAFDVGSEPIKGLRENATPQVPRSRRWRDDAIAGASHRASMLRKNSESSTSSTARAVDRGRISRRLNSRRTPWQEMATVITRLRGPCGPPTENADAVAGNLDDQATPRDDGDLVDDSPMTRPTSATQDRLHTAFGYLDAIDRTSASPARGTAPWGGRSTVRSSAGFPQAGDQRQAARLGCARRHETPRATSVARSRRARPRLSTTSCSTATRCRRLGDADRIDNMITAPSPRNGCCREHAMWRSRWTALTTSSSCGTRVHHEPEGRLPTG